VILLLVLVHVLVFGSSLKESKIKKRKLQTYRRAHLLVRDVANPSKISHPPITYHAAAAPINRPRPTFRVQDRAGSIQPFECRLLLNHGEASSCAEQHGQTAQRHPDRRSRRGRIPPGPRRLVRAIPVSVHGPPFASQACDCQRPDAFTPRPGGDRPAGEGGHATRQAGSTAVHRTDILTACSRCSGLDGHARTIRPGAGSPAAPRLLSPDS